MTHPSQCVCVSLSPSFFSCCPIPCFPFWYSNSNFPTTKKQTNPVFLSLLSHQTLSLSAGPVRLPPLHCNAADVVPLLVLTSGNLRKNLAIILQCRLLKGERLNPLLCAHLCRECGSRQCRVYRPVCPRQNPNGEVTTLRHVKAQPSTQFVL